MAKKEEGNPKQVHTFRSNGCRLQVLVPPPCPGLEPRYYDLEGVSFRMDHIIEFEDVGLETKIGEAITGTFDMVAWGSEGRIGPRERKIKHASDHAKVIAMKKSFDEEMAYLKKREGLRVIRFKKGEKSAKGGKV